MKDQIENLIQSELATMKRDLIKEITLKLNEISFKFQNSLDEVLFENQKLQTNLAKSSSEAQLLRKVLQDILLKFPNLYSKNGIQEITKQEKKVTRNIKTPKAAVASIKPISSLAQPPAIIPIEAGSQAEEETIAALEMDVIMESKKIEDGATMSKRNMDILSKGIPYPMKSVTVHMVNYAEMLLVNPEFFIKNQREHDCRSGLTPHSIGSCTREALFFHDNHALDLEGLFTYQVGNTNLRLAVLFALLNDASTWLFGVAFTPRNIETNQDLYNYISMATSKNPLRSDVKFAWIYSYDANDLIVKHGDFRARASFMPGRRVQMEVEVMQVLQNRPSMEKRLVVSDGKTLQGKTLEGIAASISEKYGCVLEITNGLNVGLGEIQYYDYNPCKENNWKELSSSIPTDIPALTRQAFYFSDPKNVHGMLSYTITSTDIRLAVMFQTSLGGNSFSIAFVPSKMSETLIASLTNEPALWKTQPNQKLGKANDGEKVVEIRNIRAKVTMSEKAKSLLRVFISTF